MAEFDAFESAGQQPPQQEEDPAADFLAREQDQLAALGEDNLAGSEQAAFGGAEPQADMFGGESLMTANVTSGGDDLLAAFGSPEPAVNSSEPATAASEAHEPVMVEVAPAEPNPTAAIDDVLAEFDGPGQPSDSMMNDMGMMGTMGDDQSQDVFSAIAQADVQRGEPEKIRTWRLEHEERLTKKDSEEQDKMEEWRQIARQELEDWYKHRDEQLEKAKVSNREGEAAFIKERDETLPGQAWEKICRLCEFNPKNNKSTKDNSRMRSILLQLKQTPLVR